jgi:hypothetical protein
MSTLTTIETPNTNLILSNLHPSSLYYISVSICNYFDCGSSSLAIDIKIPSSSTLKGLYSLTINSTGVESRDAQNFSDTNTHKHLNNKVSTTQKYP